MQAQPPTGRAPLSISELSSDCGNAGVAYAVHPRCHFDGSNMHIGLFEGKGASCNFPEVPGQMPAKCSKIKDFPNRSGAGARHLVTLGKRWI